MTVAPIENENFLLSMYVYTYKVYIVAWTWTSGCGLAPLLVRGGPEAVELIRRVTYSGGTILHWWNGSSALKKGHGCHRVDIEQLT